MLCAAMLIQLDNHAVGVSELCAHFRRSGFRAESVGGGMVSRVAAPTEDQERRDLLLHLRVWEVSNPGMTTTIVI
jgi:hypothetical protein